MPRIGLVLGAGGVVGHAFHAGVLSAILERTGWDAREAEIVVGTSAGSVVGALLRAGLGPHDLAARAMGRPLSAEGARLLARTGAPPPPMSFPRPQEGDRARPAAPEAFANAILRPWTARPGALAAAALPEGRIPTEQVVAGIRPFFDGDWPRRPLWIVAVRLADGRRTVFGTPEAPQVDVPTAVAASCAIPAWFSPVTAADERYVDGGVHSPTNLDLLSGERFDLIVVSSSMSAAGGRTRRAVDLPVRRVARALLRAEAARVSLRGTRVLTFEPTPDDQEQMGPNAMDPSRRGAVTRCARESALRRLERPDVAERLETLTAAARASAPAPARPR